MFFVGVFSIVGMCLFVVFLCMAFGYAKMCRATRYLHPLTWKDGVTLFLLLAASLLCGYYGYQGMLSLQ